MKYTRIIATIMLLVVFFLFAIGSEEEESGSVSTSTKASNATEQATENAPTGNLGDYIVEIDSFRLANDYEGSPVVIVKYIFTNVSDEDPTSFSVAFEDAVYQNGVGLNKSYFVEDSANYEGDDASKEIKAGATIVVEIAYELNDTTTDIEVEVSEFWSWSDDKVVKTFKIS